ncbi:conserved protein, unknown function [Hepatocystis sp. ex Piliocolobus tephrosceles]|nr:conserved protein, unknown function [Hepatocystis sp. ex Piliocolobus tephrosceles]
MTYLNISNFDVDYFMKSCTHLEQSYEKLLSEKKKGELKLNETIKSLQEIKEKYEQEKKSNLEMSTIISEHTDELVQKQNYLELYEIAKRQNEEFREKIEILKRERDQEKLNMEEKIKIMKAKEQKEIESYEKHIRENINKLLELERINVEKDLNISAKDKEINNLTSLINETNQEHEKEKIRFENKIKELIIENENQIKKNKEDLKDIINSDSFALCNLKKKYQSLQQDYYQLEKEYLLIKKNMRKMPKKGTPSDHLNTGCNKNLYKI